MECPHCTTTFHPQYRVADVTSHSNPSRDYLVYQLCPACNKNIIFMLSPMTNEEMNLLYKNNFQDLENQSVLLFPKTKKRKPLSSDIPEDFIKEYNEAYDVLGISPKASSALSRRCLQRLLLTKASVTKRDLYDQIQEVLDSKQLPSHLANDIDSIRRIGKFAAHPIKSTSTGTIIDVEPEEAAWTLKVLEGLFDFYFVSPAESKRRNDALNKKK